MMMAKVGASTIFNGTSEVNFCSKNPSRISRNFFSSHNLVYILSREHRRHRGNYFIGSRNWRAPVLSRLDHPKIFTRLFDVFS